MKRLLILVLVVVFALSFVGCEKAQGEDNGSEMVLLSHEKVGVNGGYYQIFYHKETKVMYLFHKDGYGGGLTVMVDENGKPLLYEVKE